MPSRRPPFFLSAFSAQLLAFMRLTSTSSEAIYLLQTPSLASRPCTSIQNRTADFDTLAKAQVLPLLVHDGSVRRGSSLVDACRILVSIERNKPTC